jgi:hypothetical protein
MPESREELAWFLVIAILYVVACYALIEALMR